MAKKSAYTKVALGAALEALRAAGACAHAANQHELESQIHEVRALSEDTMTPGHVKQLIGYTDGVSDLVNRYGTIAVAEAGRVIEDSSDLEDVSDVPSDQARSVTATQLPQRKAQLSRCRAYLVLALNALESKDLAVGPTAQVPVPQPELTAAS